MGTVRKGVVNRSVEVFPGPSGADQIRFHGKNTLDHPDVLRRLESLGKVHILNTEAGRAIVEPPLTEEDQQALVDAVDEAYPADLTMINDRRGDFPYANPAIYPSHCQ